MPSGQRLREHEIAEILRRFRYYMGLGYSIMEACERIADKMGLPRDTVYRVKRRFMPSTDAATDYLKANSLKLAMRVVRKAGVRDSLDVLSNPKIGVLDAPRQDSGNGGGSQFVIGVQVDSLGAVHVAMATGKPPAAIPSGAPSVIDYTQGESAPQLAPAPPEEEQDFPRNPYEPDPIKMAKRKAKRVEILPELAETPRFVARQKVTVVAHQKALARELKSQKRKESRDATERRKRLRQEMQDLKLRG